MDFKQRIIKIKDMRKYRGNVIDNPETNKMMEEDFYDKLFDGLILFGLNIICGIGWYAILLNHVENIPHQGIGILMVLSIITVICDYYLFKELIK